MKRKWTDWLIAICCLLALVGGTALTTAYFITRNGEGDAGNADPSRVEKCIVSNGQSDIPTVEPLGEGIYVGLRASRGAFLYDFGGDEYVVAFTESPSEAETLATDAKRLASVMKMNPNFIRSKGSIAYWSEESSDNYLLTIEDCLS